MTTLYYHPEFLQKQADWIKARDLYEGRHDVLTGGEYLWYHQIESISTDPTSSKIRRSREQRTRYFNFSEILTSLLISIFFKKPPRPDQKAKTLLEKLDAEHDIDGFGTNLESFIQNKITSSLINFGKVVVLVDAYPIQAASLADQQENKLRPYMELIAPLKAMDWSRETQDPTRLGKWNFYRYEFDGVMPRAKPTDRPELRRFSHELVLNDGGYEITQRYVLLDENFSIQDDYWDSKTSSAEWAGGESRIVKMDHIPVSVYESESWLKDANEESLRYHNIRSNRDNIIYQQGYQDKYIVGVDSADTKRVQALNEYITKLLPENGNAFAIEPVDPIAYEKAEREAISNIFKVGLNRLRDLPIDSREAQSSESIDKQNEFTYSLIQSELCEIEGVVNSALKDFAEFAGASDFDGKIELEREISEEDFNKFQKTWLAFRDLFIKYPEIEPEVAKKALKNLRLDKDTEQELDKKIGQAKIVNNVGEQEPDRVTGILNGGSRKAPQESRY